MRNLVITLSLFALVGVSYGQTATDAKDKDSDIVQIINALNESGSSFTIDTLADGNIKIEITESPNLPQYHNYPEQTSDSRFAVRRKAATTFLLIILLISLPILYFIKRMKK